SQAEILSGRGFGGSVGGKLLSAEELRGALAASLSLYLAARVRRISPEALEEMAYYITGRRGVGERMEGLLESLKGRMVDPASFYFSLKGLPEKWFDPALLLSAALYAMADQLLLKYLEYMGVLPILDRVVSYLKRVGEDVMAALSSVAGFFKDLLTEEGYDNPSLEYLREILVDGAGLQESLFLRFMVEDRSSSRFNTYRGEVVDSWPALPLEEGSGEEELTVVLTSQDPSTWIYDGEEVVGYRAKVYRLSFSLKGEVVFPFQEVDVSSSPELRGLLSYVQEAGEGGVSEAFMRLIDAVVQRILSAPEMQRALSPYYAPLELNPAGDKAPMKMLERAREAMEVVRERARGLSGGLDDLVRQLLSSHTTDLAAVVEYLNQKYDEMVGRDEQIDFSVSHVVSSLTPQQVSFQLLETSEEVVDEISDSDHIVSSTFPSAPPSGVVLRVALDGGVRQESIRGEVEGWVKVMAERAYSMVKEREVGRSPQGVIVQALYSTLRESDVEGVLDIFFGGVEVDRPLIQMASDFALLSLEEYSTSLEAMGVGRGVYIPEDETFWEVVPSSGYPPIKPHIITLTNIDLGMEVLKWSEKGVHATDPGKISTMPFSTKGSLHLRVTLSLSFEEVSPRFPGGESVDKSVEFNISGGYFYLSPYPVEGIRYSSSDTLGKDLWEAIKAFFSYIWGEVKEPLEKLWGRIKEVISFILKWVGKILDGAREVISYLNGVINTAVEVVRSVIEGLLQKALDLIRKYVLSGGETTSFRTEILSFTIVIVARRLADPGEDLLRISVLKGPLNATFRQVYVSSTRSYPTLDVSYREGKTSLKAHIDPTQSEGGPIYLIEGPLYIKGHGGILHLEGPTPVVYRRAEVTLSGVLKRRPQIPIPPLGVVAEIDLGIRMDYLLSPQTGVYLNEYGEEGWVELFNPEKIDLTGYTITVGGRRVSVAEGGVYPVVLLPGPLKEGDEVTLRDENGTVLDTFTLPRSGSYSRIVDGVGRWIEQGETRGRSNSGG
ncbi:MAG: hypothetical protein J7L88_00635, partial [Thermoplasmata archaeon]|nr:hypothetical protein [Thermoplasmata archaeon]